MKRKILTVILLAVLTVSMLAGCGQTETASTAETKTEESTVQPEATEEATITPEPTEEPHTHNYTETITTEATCEADGLKTFTCECGDTYTEPISATGHLYENYVSNNDATYLADGTETATCVCGLTDTRTAEGSKLEYTYTDMNATMYATQTVNVRNLPCTDGEKIGSLSTNQEITVLGQCNETSWYKFELDGQTAFVSNSYLSNEKVEVQQSTGGGGNSLANHFGITLPFTASYNSGDPTTPWGLVWNSNTSFNPDVNYICKIPNGTQVTISNISGSKNDCMAYVTMPDGISGWVKFSYNGYTKFTW